MRLRARARVRRRACTVPPCRSETSPSRRTPRTLGATGFLAQAGAIQLGDVTLESAVEFGTILVVALDGRPLAESKRILVQTMSEERPYGWKTEGKRIADLGGPPMLVRAFEGSVSLRRGARLKKATVLDVHGYARRPAKRMMRGDTLVVTLPEDALYTVLE